MFILRKKMGRQRGRPRNAKRAEDKRNRFDKLQSHRR
jgi:hypothetical protein